MIVPLKKQNCEKNVSILPLALLPEAVDFFLKILIFLIDLRFRPTRKKKKPQKKKNGTQLFLNAVDIKPYCTSTLYLFVYINSYITKALMNQGNMICYSPFFLLSIVASDYCSKVCSLDTGADQTKYNTVRFHAHNLCLSITITVFSLHIFHL